MQINIDIKGIKDAINKLSNDAANIERATIRGINNTARNCRLELKNTMQEVFDRPTPYTLNSIYVQFANKEKPYAAIFIKDMATKGTAPSKYLDPEIKGGVRHQKAFEKLLQEAGRIKGKYLLPFKATLDRYGNVKASTIQQVLSGLQAQRDGNQNSPSPGKGYKGTRSARKVPYRYSVVERNGKQMIFQFSKGHAVPLFMTADSVSYRKRFDFYMVADKFINANLKKEIVKEIK
jgi:hypothetical protein